MMACCSLHPGENGFLIGFLQNNEKCAEDTGYRKGQAKGSCIFSDAGVFHDQPPWPFKSRATLTAMLMTAPDPSIERDIGTINPATHRDTAWE